MSRALASLTAQYSDSDNEAEDQEPDEKPNEEVVSQYLKAPHLDVKIWSASNSPASISNLNTVECLNKENDVETTEAKYDLGAGLDDTIYEEEYEERLSSPVSFHRSVLNTSPQHVRIPSEPLGRCANSLVDKINGLYEKKKGRDMNASIQKRKNFRNPSIYEKLIAYCRIDELGTNYPPEIYDPHKWGPESYYEELAKRQKEEMDKREKERSKERTKVEFVTGTAKKASSSEINETRKKSKWDVTSSSSSTVVSGTRILGSGNLSASMIGSAKNTASAAKKAK